jgi:hypothetical protein
MASENIFKNVLTFFVICDIFSAFSTPKLIKLSSFLHLTRYFVV